MQNPSLLRKCYIGTAFLEGISVLIIEIAGARALAPFFGSSLKVWTAQITATLLFLAVGYWFGGKISEKQGKWGLPVVFIGAGSWLTMFSFIREPVLESASHALGIAGGSFTSAVALYGFPLLMLGAVSPLLVERQDRLNAGAGKAAGTIFFTNTMGGLAGGWLTALLLIPHVPLRLVLTATGGALILIGILWWLLSDRHKPTAPIAALVILLSTICFLTFYAPKTGNKITVSGFPATVLYAKNSSVGLIQVIDIPAIATRSLLLDGAVQGGETRGLSAYPFTEYQNFLSHRFHPHAKRALLLGLGAGTLAKQLVKRGVDVTVVELEPRIGDVARQFFSLPKAVRLFYEDARTYLNSSNEHYDIVFLDVFTAENTPWYMLTTEAIEKIENLLLPNGILVINTIAWVGGISPDVVRLESALLEHFSDARVFVSSFGAGEKPQQVTNAVLVAGANLSVSHKPFPNQVLFSMQPKLEDILRSMRPAIASVAPPTDDFNDLEYAGANIRVAVRKILIRDMGADVLGY